MKKLNLYILIFALCALNAIPSSYAQVGQNEENVLDETVTDVYIVVGTSVAGAVLGLSTLSFVEEPGDHLKNIVVGLALGTIVGVGIVAYKTANKSKDLYIQNAYKGGPEFKTWQRKAWHKKSFSSNIKQTGTNPTLLGYSFEFLTPKNQINFDKFKTRKVIVFSFLERIQILGES